ncbi:MAG: GNAT family N-acetyltransferase [Ignavibacteriaceae bacterium]
MYKEVATENQIEIVKSLAKEIWSEHYIPIIGKVQVDYMLEKFQSNQAIAKQIKTGYLYFLIEEENKPVGYIGLIPKVNELFLSKIYIKSSERGKGYAKKAIQFVEDLAKEKGLKKITLTVNKNNINAIKVYEKIGFKNLGSIVQDIGNGFIMDDYEMEKELEP